MREPKLWLVHSAGSAAKSKSVVTRSGGNLRKLSGTHNSVFSRGSRRHVWTCCEQNGRTLLGLCCRVCFIALAARDYGLGDGEFLIEGWTISMCSLVSCTEIAIYCLSTRPFCVNFHRHIALILMPTLPPFAYEFFFIFLLYLWVLIKTKFKLSDHILSAVLLWLLTLTFISVIEFKLSHVSCISWWYFLLCYDCILIIRYIFVLNLKNNINSQCFVLFLWYYNGEFIESLAE